MRQLFYQLALSTALISGAAAVAQADCSSKTVSADNTTSFQLAQAGGGSGSAGGSGSTTGNTGGGTGAGANPGSTSGTSPNSTSGGGAAGPIIPQDRPMRALDTPGTPPQPGIGQTNR